MRCQETLGPDSGMRCGMLTADPHCMPSAAAQSCCRAAEHEKCVPVISRCDDGLRDEMREMTGNSRRSGNYKRLS